MTRGWWLGAALAALAAGWSSGDFTFPTAPREASPVFAAIPAEVRAELPRPDSTAWFLERWEDETFAPGMAGAARALPSKGATLGSLRALYHEAARLPPARP